jgi:hypothetical protein
MHRELLLNFKQRKRETCWDSDEGVQFGDETMWRIQVYDCDKSFKEGRTKAANTFSGER